MDFLSANSGFAIQNDGKFLPRITRETCIRVLLFHKKAKLLVVEHPAHTTPSSDLALFCKQIHPGQMIDILIDKQNKEKVKLDNKF